MCWPFNTYMALSNHQSVRIKGFGGLLGENSGYYLTKIQYLLLRSNDAVSLKIGHSLRAMRTLGVNSKANIAALIGLTFSGASEKAATGFCDM